MARPYRYMKERGVWHRMHDRCRGVGRRTEGYVARNITVCKRWSGPKGFANFINDMGPRPPGPSYYWTLERINNNRGYSPKNCKWATQAENRRNSNQNSWGQQRLTIKQVRAIRTDPRRPYRIIATDYGITRHMVGMIIRGDRRQHY